ncbi:glycosyltransferase family 4 protein [Luteococcus sp. H138]|uniref:glycosyltransferase family 4 protein n=1 Tax=unclassified Luteococcus TaxID=2639923 RepID=UPI00313DCD37
MTRIAQVLVKPQLGGAETLVSSLEAEFTARGIETRTVYLDPEGPAQGPAGRIRTLRRQLRDFHPTHILAHSALPNVYARLAAAPRTPVTCVLHSASDDFADPMLRCAEWVLLPRTAAVIAVSQVAHQQYTSRFPNRDRVVLVNNGAAADFHPEGPRARTPTRFVSVARVADQKNPQVWIDAVTAAGRELPQARFTWWGPAGSEDYQRVMDEFNAAQPHAHFEGATSQAAQRMREADVFLHTADAEANSIVLLEAAASGLPIICSEAVAATLPEDFHATAFRTGDAADCLRAIREVGERWEDSCAQADRNEALVNERFRMGPVTDRYLRTMGIN